MALARTTVYVTDDCALDGHAVCDPGAVYAWLELGEYELGVWGSPAAMRRLAAAATGAAEAADRAETREHDDQAAHAAA
jgi:hypothetical protein